MARSRYRSPEWRAAISRGVRRHLEIESQQKPLRPALVEQWKRDGRIAPELRPVVEARVERMGAMIQDLGGVETVTAMQRALLEGPWLQAQVAADVEFARFLRDGDPAALERLATYLNAARSALVAVGMERVAKPVPSLAEYLAQRDRETREAEAAQAARGSENGAAREDEVVVVEDRAALGEAAREDENQAEAEDPSAGDAEN